MKVWKKVLSSVLAVSMVLGSFSASGITAFAADEDNLALGAQATANDVELDCWGADKTVDGIVNRDESNNRNQSRWSTNTGSDAKVLTLNLGETKTFNKFVIEWERTNIKGFNIQVSDDGETFKTVYTKPDESYVELTTTGYIKDGASGQYVRMIVDGYDGGDINWPSVSVYEFELYEVDEIPTEPVYTLNSVIASLQVPEIEVGADKWVLPELPDGFAIEFVGADYEQIIDKELNIYQPLVDTTVEVSYTVSNADESKTTSMYQVLVPGQYETEEGDNEKPVVIPSLAEWKGHTGDFAVTETSKVVVNPEYMAELTYAADRFAVDFEEVTGQAIGIAYSTEAKAGDFYFTLGCDDAGLGEEGYIMTIADYVTVEAEEKTGAFWAVQTVMQILKQTDGTMPKGITRDYPKFEVRGFMLDVGRKPFTMEYLYETVKTMAYYKMNDFGVHLNDNYIWVEEYNNTETDQWGAYSAFRMESDVKEGGNGGKNKADLTAKDFFYTKDEFRTFIKDAREMGIDVVPEFDAPAHALALTKVRPDLAMPEDSVNRWADHLYLENPESEEFVKDIWNEYLTGENPVFDAETIINVGTDEYEGNNNAFRQFTANMIEFVQASGRTVRHWGSITAKPGSVEVPSKDVQMYVWNTGWANPTAMFKAGFDIINIQDSYVYMVPNGNNNRGGYGDRLNVQSLYGSWAPNKFGSTVIPANSEHMLGGAYAIWNDNIDRKANGLNEYDLFDRFFEAAPIIAEKAWNDGSDQAYADFAASAETIGLAPGTNPYSEVASKKDKVVEYDFDNEDITDASKNHYDGEEGENTAYAEGKEGKALELKGGSSYVTTPIEAIGPTVEVSFWVKAAADAEGEQVLFDDGHTQVKMSQGGSGKVGFTCEFFDYTFNYALPADEWVELTFKTAVQSTELYVNGELVDTVSASMTGGKHATLVFPLAMIGSETDAFTGLVDEITVTKAEVKVIDDSASRIPTGGFTVTCDNQYGGTTTEGVIGLAFDGNPSTIWHSNYSPYQALPATIEINMGQPYVIDQFDYLPRQDGSRNGRILTYELYGKLAEADEYTLITEGSFASTMDLKRVSFDAAEYQYLKFVALTGDTDSGNMFASASEFYVHEYDPKGDLKDAYAEAEFYTEEDAQDYTEASWNAFAEAKAAALAVIEKEDATAEEIADATEVLLAAIEGLVDADEEPEVTPTPTPVEPDFQDVVEGAYYYDPVMWAVENKVTSGLNATTFGVGQPCTREQIVTLLWNYAGQPQATNTACTFKDVNPAHYYYNAMLWAVENGIVSGYNPSTFGVGDACTREQIVMIIWKYVGEPTATKTACTFKDVNPAHYYYKAMLWAVENGIVSGYNADTFGMGDACTREQIVTFLFRTFTEREANPIIGTWSVTYAYDDLFERFGADIDVYMDYESVSLTETYSFFWDNTFVYTATVDEFVDSFENMLRNGFDGYFGALVKENHEAGFVDVTVNDFWEEFQMSRDDVLGSLGYGNLKEELTSYVEGRYSAKDGKLSSSDDVTVEPPANAYETYEVTDSTLTLTGYYEDGKLVEGGTYPVSYARVK